MIPSHAKDLTQCVYTHSYLVHAIRGNSNPTPSSRTKIFIFQLLFTCRLSSMYFAFVQCAMVCLCMFVAIISALFLLLLLCCVGACVRNAYATIFPFTFVLFRLVFATCVRLCGQLSLLHQKMQAKMHASTNLAEFSVFVT